MQFREDGKPIRRLVKKIVAAGELTRDPTSLYKRILSYSVESIVPIAETFHFEDPGTVHKPKRLEPSRGLKGVLAIQDDAARIYSFYNVSPAEVLEGIRKVITKGRQ